MPRSSWVNTPIIWRMAVRIGSSGASGRISPWPPSRPRGMAHRRQRGPRAAVVHLRRRPHRFPRRRPQRPHHGPPVPGQPARPRRHLHPVTKPGEHQHSRAGAVHHQQAHQHPGRARLGPGQRLRPARPRTHPGRNPRRVEEGQHSLTHSLDSGARSKGRPRRESDTGKPGERCPPAAEVAKQFAVGTRVRAQLLPGFGPGVFLWRTGWCRLPHLMRLAAALTAAQESRPAASGAALLESQGPSVPADWGTAP